MCVFFLISSFFMKCILQSFYRVSGSRTSLFMRFKSTAKDGLLLWRGDSPMRPNSDFLSMGLQDGALIFRYLSLLYMNGTIKRVKYVMMSYNS